MNWMWNWFCTVIWAIALLVNLNVVIYDHYVPTRVLGVVLSVIAAAGFLNWSWYATRQRDPE